MQYLTRLFFLLFVVVSCDTKQADSANNSAGHPTEPQLARIVRGIEAGPVVEDELIGDPEKGQATKSVAYQQFRQLCANATDAELLELLKSKSNVVRAYTFWGLAVHNYPKTYEVLKSIAKDTSTVLLHTQDQKHKVALRDFCFDIIFNEEGNRYFPAYRLEPFEMDKAQEEDLAQFDTTLSQSVYHRLKE